MTSKITAISLLALFMAFSSQAADLEKGKQTATTLCVACHGADGQGTMPMYPKLAGQYADYLTHSLKAYKSGERKNAIMAGMVASLSSEDIENVAAYYASLPTQLSIMK